MGNLTIAAIFIVLMNVLMWFSTIAMQTVNPTGTFCYHTEGSIIAGASTANLSTVDNDILSQLPGAESEPVSAGSNVIFTDVFNTMVTWFKSAPGIKYVYGVVAAPYNILKCMNLGDGYNEFIVGVGILWYVVSLLVLLAFFRGLE